MEPRRRFNMFAHQVDAMGEEFCRMHRTAPKPGTSSGMCAFPEELDLHLVDCCRAEVGDLGKRPGMPRQSDVKIIEQACASHVDLGSFGLFGGASIQADSAWDLVLSHHILRRDGRPDT